TSNGSGPIAALPYCDDGTGTPAPNLDCNGDGAGDTCASRTVGGAVFLNNMNGTWTGNSFTNNTSLARQNAYVDASGQGGAMAIFTNGGTSGVSPNLSNNTFTGNVANAGQGASYPSPNPLCGYFNAWGG